MLKPLQPTVIILPTRELIEEYLPLDPRFFFYRGGVKGVIRDAVAQTVGTSMTGQQSWLLHSVVYEYEQYELECLHSNVPLEDCVGPFEELELILDIIEEDVQKFLETFFSGQQFEIIRPIEFIANDLMVHAKVF